MFVEIMGVGDTTFKCDLLDRLIRRQQEVSGHLDTKMQKIAVHCRSKLLMETEGEEVAAQAGRGGQFGNAKRALKIAVEPLLDCIERCLGTPPGVAGPVPVFATEPEKAADLEKARRRRRRQIQFPFAYDSMA